MSYKLFKFYEKDGYYHLKRIDEPRLLEMARNYQDIVEAFIRNTMGETEVKKYREAMDLYRTQEEYEDAVKKSGI
jgi:hypothetical protein